MASRGSFQSQLLWDSVKTTMLFVKLKKMQNADLSLQQLLKDAEENWFYLTLRRAMLLGERREQCCVELR